MRSKLFVPGSRPELFEKALASTADALSFDLEDAVTDQRKPEARLHVQKFLEAAKDNNKKIIVRSNHVSSEHFKLDVPAIVRNGLDILNIPKVESTEEIYEAAQLLSLCEQEYGVKKRIGILVNIESPKGLRRAQELAVAHERVVGLQIGYGDLFSPLEMDRRNISSVEQVMFSVRMAAGEANIMAVDGAFTHVADIDGFLAEAEMARKFGYVGKSCIHPSQIEHANKVFRPTAEDIAHCVNVLKSLKERAGDEVGAFTIDGRMVDAPLFERARQVVSQAVQLGIIDKQP